MFFSSFSKFGTHDCNYSGKPITQDDTATDMRQRCRLSVRQKFFSQRVVNVWNKLTASVVEATSVNTFKKRLDKWMDVEL